MKLITLLLVLLLSVPSYGQMIQTSTAADSLFDLLVGKTGSQLGEITSGVTNIGSKTYWDDHAYEYIERLVDKMDQMDSLTMISNNLVNAQWFDSLETAFDWFSANIDTGVLYIPAGVYTIYDSLNLVYKRAGRAYWGIIGDPGGTVIKAENATTFDSTMNMLNIVTSGITSSTDTCIAFLDISGINFDHNEGGGTRFYWATGDSGGHALRTYRWDTHDLDVWPESGETVDEYFDEQWGWVDGHSWIICSYGRIWTFNIHNCRFENSNGGAIRTRSIRTNAAIWSGPTEGGHITSNTFHTIRGCAIATCTNTMNVIADNFFRWVGIGIYADAGGQIISNNRCEEYDSAFVYADISNWTHIFGNVISEGAQAAIHLGGNCSGSITNNSFLNIIADNAYMGAAWQDDTVASVIEIEAFWASGTPRHARGMIISNNFMQTHDSEYDMPTRYFIEGVYDGNLSGADSSAVDSIYGLIINNNVIGYGLGTDLTLGFTNLSSSRNIITNNIVLDTTGNYLHTSSEWIIGTGTGTFTTTATNDTVVISGATSSDKYILSPYGSAVDSADVLMAWAKEDTLIVIRAGAGTSGLTYRYLRIK